MESFGVLLGTGGFDTPAFKEGQFCARCSPLGKIIGGGLPIGAVGGREDVMQLTATDSDTLAHFGAFNGNTYSIAAGLASLEARDQSRMAI